MFILKVFEIQGKFKFSTFNCKIDAFLSQHDIAILFPIKSILALFVFDIID